MVYTTFCNLADPSAIRNQENQYFWLDIFSKKPPKKALTLKGIKFCCSARFSDVRKNSLLGKDSGGVKHFLSGAMPVRK